MTDPKPITNVLNRFLLRFVDAVVDRWLIWNGYERVEDIDPRYKARPKTGRTNS